MAEGLPDLRSRIVIDTSQLDGLHARVSGAFGGLGAIAATAVAGAGTAIAGFAIKSAGDLEQVKVAFEGLLGSADKANDFLGKLREFAAKTPFEFPGLADAARKLLGVGVAADDVIPTLTKIGNVTASLGVGQEGIEGVIRALGQMKGKGKASAEEMQQISEAVPGFSAVAAVAKGMGTTVEDVFKQMQAGALPASTAIDAILKGMEQFPGAAGAMERQSQTLLGVFSTLKDNVRDILTDAFTPLLPALKDLVGALGPVIKALGPALGSVVKALIPVIQSLAPVIETLAPPLAAIIGLLGQFLQPVAQIIAALAPVVALILQLSQAFLSALLPAIQPLVPVLTEVIGKIATALQPVIAQIIPIIQQNADAYGKVLTALLPLLPALGDLLIALLPILPPLIELATLQVRLIGLMAPLIELVAKLAAVLIGALATAITAVVNFLRNDLIKWFEKIPDVIGRILPAIAGFATAVLAFFTELPGKIVAALGNVDNLLFDVGKRIIEGLIRGIKSLPGAVGSAIKGVLGGGVNVAKSVLGIGSPSKVFKEFGHATAEGYIIGVQDMDARINGALKKSFGFDSLPFNVGATNFGVAAASVPATAALASSVPFVIPDERPIENHLHAYFDDKEVSVHTAPSRPVADRAFRRSRQ